MQFRPEQIVFLQGKRERQPMMVTQGMLKSVHLTEDGDEVILRVHCPGDVFGVPPEDCEVRAVIATRVRSFDIEPAFLRGLLEERVKDLEQRMIETQTLSAANAVIAMMLHIHQRTREDVIPLTQTELAQLCGTTFFTVNRVFSFLHKSQAIEIVSDRPRGMGGHHNRVRVARIVNADIMRDCGPLCVLGGKGSVRVSQSKRHIVERNWTPAPAVVQ